MDLSRLPKHADVVWASPPCTQYSVARTTAKTPRDLEGSDRLAGERSKSLASTLSCHWFMENPMGLLRHREVVQGLPMTMVDYCQYGFQYRKRTCIWSNGSTPGARGPAREGCLAAAAAVQGPLTQRSGPATPRPHQRSCRAHAGAALLHPPSPNQRNRGRAWSLGPFSAPRRQQRHTTVKSLPSSWYLFDWTCTKRPAVARLSPTMRCRMVKKWRRVSSSTMCLSRRVRPCTVA